MAEAQAPKLYSPQVLALATGLAEFPLKPGLTLHAEARSRTCGSAIALGLALDHAGRIARVGMQVSACAIGQASAAVMARGIQGRKPEDMAAVEAAIARWLTDPEAALPDWPDLALIAPARAHPARHGALLLPWNAASKALSTGAAAG
jgi:NifU-like protein involved in Fe-S cluster formation